MPINTIHEELPYYHHALVKRVGTIVVVPLVLLIIILLARLYFESLDKTKQLIQEHSRAAASQLNRDLQDLRYATSRLAGHKAVSEVPVNILFSQSTLALMQDIVEDNPYVDGVFIQDDSGFIIEGYPLQMLRVQSDYLTLQTQRLMAKKPGQSIAEILWVDKDKIFDSKSKVDSYSPLIIAETLFRETESIINPFRATGAIYVVANLHNMTNALSHQSQKYGPFFFSLRHEQDELWRNAQVAFKEVLQANSAIGIPILLEGQSEVITLSTLHQKHFYDRQFWNDSLFEILPLLVLIPVMMLLLRRFTRRLSLPVNEMVEMCRSFSSGQYHVATANAQYREFSELFERMQAMAKMISNQLNTLDDAKKRAERSEQAKSQFLANMSHEIRTPMNGVLGMLQLLQNDELTEAQLKKLNIAVQSAENLLTIINDILDFSKIEANKIEIEKLPCDVEKLVRSATLAVQISAEQRGNSVVFETEGNLAPAYLTDPTRITQILNNLLSNAVKFTENGVINVTLKTQSDQQPGFRVEVQDSGIGIPEEKLSGLFEPFQQADASTTRRFGGTGLGLTISKNLCELLNGSLSVKSKVGEGTTFCMSIVAEPQDNVVDPAKKVVTKDCYFEGKRVLVAEDNEINQEVLKAMLEPTNIRLVFTANGQEALEKFPRVRPHLVLMDVHMPLMDGIEATQKIREIDTCTPIVMQTANVMAEDVNLYMETGAQDVIAKPLIKEHLLHTLERWLNQ